MMRAAFRVDSSVAIGTGHVMRCLVLADALKRDGAHTLFVTRDLPGEVSAHAAAAGHDVVVMPSWVQSPAGADEDARQTMAVLDERGAWDWIVVDHYGLGEAWERAMRARASHILAIDDLADRRHDCDVLLDAGGYAAPARRYAGLVPDGCVTLLGPRYALLRPELLEVRQRARQRAGRVERLLVSFGGTDPTAQTASALAGVRLAAALPRSIDVVVGSSNPNAADIDALCRKLPGARLHVQPAGLAALMEAADLCLGAGGLAAWERCAIGLPSIVTPVAANQLAAMQYLAGRNCIWLTGTDARAAPQVYAGLLERAAREPDTLRRLSANARAMMDGCERGPAECIGLMQRGAALA
jgi:UDP-2,4-diacetamido-2,4,6-trideoxy-beta-L-altropyranose hydrolase